MALTRDTTDGLNLVRWVRDDAIGLDSGELRTSFVLGSVGAVLPCPDADLDAPSDALVALLAAQRPDVVLVGSGPRQRFPSAAARAALHRCGCGVEFMDNGAAARTFNVLAAEGRRPVVLFLLPAA